MSRRAPRSLHSRSWQVRKSVRIASLFSLFSFAIFLDSTKRIFPDSGYRHSLFVLSADRPQNSENSKANRIETMKGPAESGQICSVGRRKIAKKIAKNKRCYANTLRPAQGCC